MKKLITKLLGTTTKQVTWCVLSTWVMSVVATIVAGVTIGYDFVPLVIAVSATVAIVVSGYFYKSFNENQEKYGNINSQKVSQSAVEAITKVTEIAKDTMK